jgi:hypothetical protein
MSPAGRSVVLVVTEELGQGDEADFFHALREFDESGRSWVNWTVMDALMKPLPAGVGVVLLDLGLFVSLHREVVEKFLAEGTPALLVHLTDDRPETVAFLKGCPRTQRLKKPASIHEVLALLGTMMGNPG